MTRTVAPTSKHIRAARSSLLWLALLLAVASNACSADPSPVDASGPQDGAPPPDARADITPPRAYNGPLFLRRAEAGELSAFERDELVVASSGELELRPGGGHAGKDPYAAGTYHGGNFYNAGSYRYGVARSTLWVSARPFDSVVPSFEALTPPGTWIAVSLSVRVDGVWSKEYAIVVWASSKETVARHIVDGQDDATATVQDDTLVLTKKADALRFVVQLFSQDAATPRVRAVAAVVHDSQSSPPTDTPTPAARGKVLDVPKRSQMKWAGNGWCSPTSTSMILAYWAARRGKPELDETVPAAADGIYDFVYDGTGVWPFNMAHAASLGGGALHAVVTRLHSLHQAERLLAAELPLAISISFGAGELTGAPVSATDGHLIVVRGFTASGDVVCNDPAFATDAEVQVTYKRTELEQAWSHSRGTTYLIWPAGTTLPADPLGAY